MSENVKIEINDFGGKNKSINFPAMLMAESNSNVEGLIQSQSLLSFPCHYCVVYFVLATYWNMQQLQKLPLTTSRPGWAYRVSYNKSQCLALENNNEIQKSRDDDVPAYLSQQTITPHQNSFYHIPARDWDLICSYFAPGSRT